jgi:hypothetical protein
MTHSLQPRGITLLIAVILSSVVLTIALSLLNITYKQLVLVSAAKNSQYAFYTADSAMECALYWDQRKLAFEYAGSAYVTGGAEQMDCADPGGTSRAITSAAPSSLTTFQDTSSGTRTTKFFIPCPDGGTSGTAGFVTVIKANTGTTFIYTTGYSSCIITDDRRIERGLRVSY